MQVAATAARKEHLFLSHPRKQALIFDPQGIRNHHQATQTIVAISHLMINVSRTVTGGL